MAMGRGGKNPQPPRFNQCHRSANGGVMPDEGNQSAEATSREMPSPGALTAPPVSPTLQALHAGRVVNGTYRLTRFVGGGGMGQVWEGLHPRTKARIAVKALLPQFGLAPPVLSRFQAEAEIASSLNHPNIVRVTDFDRLPDGRPYLVMEFLQGRDLSAAIKARGRLPPAEAADIIEQIAG